MKITRIVIGDYHQFGYLNIDLTYPKDYHDKSKAGKPLDKVCFIGKNGTGKTTILNILKDTLNSLVDMSRMSDLKYLLLGKTQFCIELDIEGKRYLIGRFMEYVDETRYIQPGNLQVCLPEFYLNYPDFWNEIFVKKNNILAHELFERYHKIQADIGSRNNLHDMGYKIKPGGLLIHCPTEYSNNLSNLELHSLSNLNEGLAFGNRLPFEHRIAFDTLTNFQSLLIYQVQQRERERNEFENKEENRKKTKEELISEFDKQNPEILKVIAEKWAVILDDVGLYFDFEDVRKPIVLTDPLVAYIKDKKTKMNIPYGSLSSGIKNLIFTIGYMISLYFHRNIKSSTAIFDEPEFSLFPDILLKLIDIYTDPKYFRNTQFFFATHSPLIASQFEPEERVCLHFDDERKVYCTKGITPVGDDPNDILKNDFDLIEIMPKQGVEKWEEYLRLKRNAEKEKNQSTKERILEQLYTIRSRYKFPA